MGRHAIAMGEAGHRVATGVAEVRDQRGFTQLELSRRVRAAGRDLGRSTIAEIETKRRRVDVDDLQALAVALEIDVAALLSWTPGAVAGRRRRSMAKALAVGS